MVVGLRLGRENMRCRDRLCRPVRLPDFLRGSRIPTERLLNAPRPVTSSWSDCSLLLPPLTPAHHRLTGLTYKIELLLGHSILYGTPVSGSHASQLSCSASSSCCLSCSDTCTRTQLHLPVKLCANAHDVVWAACSHAHGPCGVNAGEYS